MTYVAGPNASVYARACTLFSLPFPHEPPYVFSSTCWHARTSGSPRRCGRLVSTRRAAAPAFRWGRRREIRVSGGGGRQKKKPTSGDLGRCAGPTAGVPGRRAWPTAGGLERGVQWQMAWCEAASARDFSLCSQLHAALGTPSRTPEWSPV